MKKGLYCFRDKKAEFWTPFPSYSDQTAVREFANAVNFSGNEFMKHSYPDIDLYKVGVFDDQTGEILSDVVYVCNGVDVVLKKGSE